MEEGFIISLMGQFIFSLIVGTVVLYLIIVISNRWNKKKELEDLKMAIFLLNKSKHFLNKQASYWHSDKPNPEFTLEENTTIVGRAIQEGEFVYKSRLHKGAKEFLRESYPLSKKVKESLKDIYKSLTI